MTFILTVDVLYTNALQCAWSCS